MNQEKNTIAEAMSFTLSGFGPHPSRCGADVLNEWPLACAYVLKGSRVKSVLRILMTAIFDLLISGGYANTAVDIVL